MAFGIVMMEHNQQNPVYDRSRCTLDLTQVSQNPPARLRHWTHATSPMSPDEPPPQGLSVLASPSMNMPVLCQYNPYSPVSQMVQSHASPSNTYAHSPGDSSTYSASPINSPQHSVGAEEYYRYGLRQAFHARQAQDYGYYGYQPEYSGGKRRKRDDELTSTEYEKRRVRRERNKQAALRCRTRRRERIDVLEQETSQIEEDNNRVESEISDLKKQMEELQQFLKDHKCSKDKGEASSPSSLKVKSEDEL